VPACQPSQIRAQVGVSIAERRAKQQKRSNSARYAAIVIVVTLIAIAASIIYSTYFLQPSFSVFQSNFNSAKQVGIYVQDYNSLIYTSTENCANKLIYNISKAGRNVSTINFFVLTNDSCIYSPGFSLPISPKNASIQECLNFSARNPSIFINYSPTNTTIIKPSKLYFIGNAEFLGECGIAYEIT